MLIRPAQPQDALAVAGVHVRSWQVGYQKLLSTDYLDNLKPEDRARRYNFTNTDPAKPKTFIAVDNGVISGFVTVSAANDADAVGCGELSALYVDPDNWGRGIGTKLINHAHNYLWATDYTEAVLWILVGNDRAAQFYRHHGWAADGSVRRHTVWNIAVDDVRYRRNLRPE